MDRRGKLLVVLGIVAGVYLLTRTRIMDTVTDKVSRLIFGEEGSKLVVYKDSGGKWTVGKGHLVLTTDRVMRNGMPTALHPYGPVKEITKAEEENFFTRDTEIARNAVSNYVRVPLTENQRAALVSLVFNIGTGAFATSTLLKALNVGNVQGAADQFLVWKWVTLPDGTRAPKLLGRRERERTLFLS